MAWAHVDPELRRLAEELCTAKELDVLKLKAAGYGTRRMALVLGIDRKSVRDRLARAERRLTEALEEEDACP